MTCLLIAILVKFACWFVGGLAGMTLVALLILALIERAEKAGRRAYRRDVRRRG